MADTSVHHEAEAWIIEHGLSRHFPGMSFSGQKLKLTWGGMFSFDAASEDQSIVVAISTSAARTNTNKLATAKFQKLKTDALYLLNLEAKARRVMVFTESSMLEYFERAAIGGRFPPSIELLHIALPTELNLRVLTSRTAASIETSPRKEMRNAP
jgi:hypothetical protein